VDEPSFRSADADREATPNRRADAGAGGVGQAIALAAPDGIVVVDEQGTIRYCNTAAAELFNRPMRELVGSPFGFPVGTGQPTEIDLMRPGEDPVGVDMHVTATTLDGDPVHIAVLRDVTRRRRAERELESALERQNIVVGVAAHELRSPLFAISLLVDVLRDRRGVLTEEQRLDLVNRIAERTGHLRTLVGKLLVASMIDAEGLRPAAEPVPVPVLEFILERLGDLDELSPHVNVFCRPGVVALVDRGEFAEMLTNYLENAFAYGRPPVEVRAVQEGDSVRISVCDRGPGVPEAFVPRLFERFSREPSSEHRVEGTGLGLWIVRHLAEANRGTAWYEPNQAGGSCFGLRLPAAP
jgi:signal transduction histidine kinase